MDRALDSPAEGATLIAFYNATSMRTASATDKRWIIDSDAGAGTGKALGSEMKMESSKAFSMPKNLDPLRVVK